MEQVIKESKSRADEDIESQLSEKYMEDKKRVN